MERDGFPIAERSYQSRIEIGPWLDAGRRLTGAAIQSYLRRSNKTLRHQQRPYCVYIHVPFCPNRCSYCALYTFAVPTKIKETLDEYLRWMARAIASHPNAFPARAPTTVHFGGGTPLFLGRERFSKLTRMLREAFGDSLECEWAVETTTSSIDSETALLLEELRFKRIHLGIQTLDDDIRQKIKRRESGGKAIEKIHFLNSKGFLISVDLILGFDNQDEEVLQNDLQNLYEAGCRMFSICELRNLRPASTNLDAEQRNYRLWCQLWSFMEEHDLKAIHLGQFGRTYKDNLYYTHPARGENCIALGPYAHGSNRGVTYANHLLPDYYSALGSRASPIKFGVRYSGKTLKLRKLERELLAHRIHRTTIQQLNRKGPENFTKLWNWWMERELLAWEKSAKAFEPTRDGSWYIGNMARQLRELAGTEAIQ